MPVNLLAPVAADLHPIAGVRIGVTEAGVRKANRKDLTVFLLDEGASVAGVFTQNRFCAAPVQVSREHLAAGKGVRAMVINTGNANAGTGADGLARARSTCQALAGLLNVAPEQVLPFSTGVIMESLPTDRIEAGLPKAGPDLNEEIVPPEANLEGKAFSLSKGCYPGQEVVARMDTYGNVRRHLVGLIIQDKTVPPAGSKLFSGDREVGWVSSAVFSPQRNAALAFGFPLRDFSAPDTTLTVEVAGTRHQATVHALPFQKHS